MVLGKSIELRRFFKQKTISFLFISLIFSFFLTICLVLSFRAIRDSLPPTKIENQKIVGYSQYFGYPLYLDTIVFFIFILSTFASAFLMHIIHRKTGKKENKI